jgi:D-alanyl-D-alanine endopeptidase (penicillin-binding protein 7)
VYTSYELLFPLLLESSNDAAAALERAGTGDLVALMNQSVRAAGARATTFADASGLSSLNVSSAAELATLTQALYSTEPHLFDITRLNQRLGEYVGWTNNSPVRDPRYLGGKHGYTEAAGRTLVALFNESLVGGEERVLGYVLLGSADLAADVASLRQYVSESVRLE